MVDLRRSVQSGKSYIVDPVVDVLVQPDFGDEPDK